MTEIGIAVIGLGWMGQAHSRSCARIPTLFPEREFEPRLVVCAESEAGRKDEALRSFGFERVSPDWREILDEDEVDVVFICAPNMLHVEMAEAVAASGKHVFCEKPVGGTPEQTAQIELAARKARVITGVGYNYRWVPLVQYTRRLVDEGRLGEISNYRGRFFSMYGSDPLGLLSWRFLHDEAGYGVTTDILSHSVDLAHMLVGPISRVVGAGETFICERPLPRPDAGTHYARGSPDDPAGEVTNEDYFGALVQFESGARGTFEVSRSIVGPQSQMAFDIYGTKGAVSWNLEAMNELRVFLTDDDTFHDGYTTVYAGDRYPHHGHFAPGDANGIGWEDTKVIEDYEFLSAVHHGKQHEPGFAEALAYVSVQAALLRSWESGAWEDVTSVRLD